MQTGDSRPEAGNGRRKTGNGRPETAYPPGGGQVLLPSGG